MFSVYWKKFLPPTQAVHFYFHAGHCCVAASEKEKKTSFINIYLIFKRKLRRSPTFLFDWRMMVPSGHMRTDRLDPSQTNFGINSSSLSVQVIYVAQNPLAKKKKKNQEMVCVTLTTPLVFFSLLLFWLLPFHDSVPALRTFELHILKI